MEEVDGGGRWRRRWKIGGGWKIGGRWRREMEDGDGGGRWKIGGRWRRLMEDRR